MHRRFHEKPSDNRSKSLNITIHAFIRQSYLNGTYKSWMIFAYINTLAYVYLFMLLAPISTWISVFFVIQVWTFKRAAKAKGNLSQHCKEVTLGRYIEVNHWSNNVVLLPQWLWHGRFWHQRFGLVLIHRQILFGYYKMY